MHDFFIQYIFLILIILALVMLANKLRVAYPVVLVLAGLLLSFTSAFSHIIIDPELVFFLFLPPLLYEAAWQTSWKELEMEQGDHKFCVSNCHHHFLCGGLCL
jgi:monovalent cation/hydrogen antiporter